MQLCKCVAQIQGVISPIFEKQQMLKYVRIVYMTLYATAYYVHVCMYHVCLGVKLYLKIAKECSSKGQRLEGRYLSECHGQTNQITVTYAHT